jgi:hypothetical protein
VFIVAKYVENSFMVIKSVKGVGQKIQGYVFCDYEVKMSGVSHWLVDYFMQIYAI